jgi:cobaltochelatase CobN
MSRAIWLVMLLVLLLARPAAGQEPAAAEPLKVALLSTSFVLTRKFDLMKALAAEQGVELAWAQVDVPGGEQAAREALDGARFVIIDAPRVDDTAMVERVVGEVLREISSPLLSVNVMSPPQRLRGERLTTGQAQRLFDYYTAGMAVNHRNLFRYLAALAAGGETAQIPAAVPLPNGGIYHPKAPDLVFAAPADYLAWWGAERGVDWEEMPVIAVEISASYISDGQTGMVDATIAGLETAGAVPLSFYRSTVTARSRAEAGGGRPAAAAGSSAGPSMATAAGFPNPRAAAGGPDPVEPMIMLGERALPDVLINNNFLGGDPEGRKQWYQSLDVPVISAILYRGGGREEYLADTAGIPAFALPFQVTTAEYIGLIDPIILAVDEGGEFVVLPEQLDMLVGKATRLARLRRAPNEDKRLALLVWNHPPGEHNQGASNLNVPRSIEALLGHLREAGYRTDPASEAGIIAAVAQMLRPRYRDEGLDELLASGHADRLPLERYLAWYEQLPAAVRERIEGQWGVPGNSGWLVQDASGPSFVIPRLQLGNLVVMPQPARGERSAGADEKDMFHDTTLPVSHAYLAAYLWIREQHGADAIIHFGTHGTQEWLPGKERGLWAYDEPNLLVGNVPVLYPYIVDNIAEAVHVKRRGRGVIISHQVPPFAPAGLAEEFVRINDLIRDYQMLEDGLVRENTRGQIIALAVTMSIHADLSWQVADLERNFDDFLRDIEDYLEELALGMQPLGLHTLGQRADAGHRASTIMQALGEDLFNVLGVADPGKVFAGDWQAIAETAPYRFVMEQVLGGQPLALFDNDAERALVARGRELDALLDPAGEIAGLLAGLAGRFVDPSYGGDPVRNPDALPTGRNMYGFDPARIPTPAAYLAGVEAMESLVLDHLARNGSYPEKLAFSMWSTETMRHLGMLEGQVMAAMGVKPIWDRGGRVIGIEVIPLEELGRPRIDPVISLTGLYRDHFPNVMQWFNRAVVLLAESDEPAAQNFVRGNTAAIYERLLARGVSPADAREFALTRVFGNESGDYGTGLTEATLASDQWEADDGQLAALYLGRMSWAYGPDPARWSSKLYDAAGEEVNVFAEQLRGTSAAVFSRSSNLRGLLDTDHPFEYLGGISMAVNHLDGAPPQLYVSNMRDPLRARLESADRFLAIELRTIYQHPRWLTEMQAEGYAGTLQLLNTVNNFWGWQVMDRSVLRDDQWQAFQEIYVMDRYELGLREWLETYNPDALAQIVERMLEAVRKGYWEAGEKTLRELAETWLEVAAEHDISSRNETFLAYVAELAAGFGLQAPGDGTSAAVAPAVIPEIVQGMRLEQQAAASAEDTWRLLWLLLLALVATGALLELGRARARAAYG